MGTPFFDYVTGPLGTPFHWYRMDGNANTFIEADLGDAPTNLPYNPGTNPIDTTMSYRQAGLTTDDLSYCISMTSGNGARRALGAANQEFPDETRGSVAFLIQGTSAGSENYFISVHPTGGSWLFFSNAAGKFVYQAIGAATFFQATSTPSGLNDGNKHLVVVTCDGSNPNRIYFDGGEVAWAGTGTAPQSSWLAFSRTGFAAAGEMCLFNSQRWSATNKPWVGKMDEVMFFGQTLTPLEVALLWDAINGTVVSTIQRYPRRRSRG